MMPAHRSPQHRTPTGPWIVDTRELGRRAGISRELRRSVKLEEALGDPDVLGTPVGGLIDLDLLLESVMEGVLVSGEVTTVTVGEGPRGLDPLSESVEARVTELYAYPGSATDETTDSAEISRIVDDLIDLEPAVRDAIVLTLPVALLCSPGCRGLCPECGGKRAELGPDHGHETIDPRWAALRERFGGTEE